jgi:protein translocase SecG subunit
MESFYNLLSIIHIFLCLVLLVLVIFQKSTSDGLISTNKISALTGNESANFVIKVTSVIAAMFIINTILIAAIGMKISKANRLVLPQNQAIETPTTDSNVPNSL